MATEEPPDLEQQANPPPPSRQILQRAAGTTMHLSGRVGASGAKLSWSAEPRHHRHDVLAHNDLLYEHTSALWQQGRKHEARFF